VEELEKVYGGTGESLWCTIKAYVEGLEKVYGESN